MRVGIVTITDPTNYGNRLQNYALYKVLHDCFHCDVTSLSATVQKPFNNGDYMGWLKESIARKTAVVPSFAEKRFGTNITRAVNFAKWDKHIPQEQYYSSDRIPEKENDQYDLFFAGSDQIWNPLIVSDSFESYFLRFADREKRAAVSASFGLDELPEEWRNKIKTYLNDIPFISVREKAGQKIVRNLTGRDVPVLIDPAMMLSRTDWTDVSCMPRVDCSKPYVLKYYLGDSEETDVDRWAKKNGYRVYELMNRKLPKLYSAGPGEFISLIRNAALVCSDSFHCIAMSIVFGKPFIVFDRKGKEDYMSSRLDTLLETFGFEDRWSTQVAEKDYLRCDYSGVEQKLEREQRRFKAYISEVLGEAEEPEHVPHLASKERCTGCSACAADCPADCIEMKRDTYGFAYPVITDETRCIHCGLCEKTCPVLSGRKIDKEYPEVYAAQAKDDRIRMGSSSGGVFTLIAEEVIRQGGCVYGAAYDENHNVYHRCVNTADELGTLRGAKYAESDLRGCFREIRQKLDNGIPVLFSGTPCQTAGLKSSLKKQYDNLFCIDFVCHGVPSPAVWQKYIAYRADQDSKGKKPTEINLRSKISGWSRYKYSVFFSYGENEKYNCISTRDLYMKLFVNNSIIRTSCFNCPFKGYNRCSDITLGDFWGIWNADPEMDDDKGTSLVLIQTEKGRRVFDCIKTQSLYKKETLENASKENPSLLVPSSINPKRDEVLSCLTNKGFSAYNRQVKMKSLKVSVKSKVRKMTCK